MEGKTRLAIIFIPYFCPGWVVLLRLCKNTSCLKHQCWHHSFSSMAKRPAFWWLVAWSCVNDGDQLLWSLVCLSLKMWVMPIRGTVCGLYFGRTQDIRIYQLPLAHLACSTPARSLCNVSLILKSRILPSLMAHCANVVKAYQFLDAMAPKVWCGCHHLQLPLTLQSK